LNSLTGPRRLECAKNEASKIIVELTWISIEIATLLVIAFIGMVLIEKFNEFTASDDVSDALRLLHEHYQSLGNAVAEYGN
jgi:hypothetical protein